MDYGAETRNRLRYGMIEGGFSIEVAVSISARCLQVEDISMVAGFYVNFYDKMVCVVFRLSRKQRKECKNGCLVGLARNRDSIAPDRQASRASGCGDIRYRPWSGLVVKGGIE